ncbi:unnamed protein product [Medioppia subpectinata]|uniref:Uncharacterized protein n=1 Tax=Medioppia subpectinata TaxID=1979941 RepID=A0A7R9KCV6_9ACAR|nr:unnamed protein product [Medioppia subpectinata]CAG2101156.1 unnamed protein product [Medioppia subpectinata]
MKVNKFPHLAAFPYQSGAAVDMLMSYLSYNLTTYIGQMDSDVIISKPLLKNRSAFEIIDCWDHNIYVCILLSLLAIGSVFGLKYRSVGTGLETMWGYLSIINGNAYREDIDYHISTADISKTFYFWGVNNERLNQSFVNQFNKIVKRMQQNGVYEYKVSKSLKPLGFGPDIYDKPIVDKTYDIISIADIVGVFGYINAVYVLITGHSGTAPPNWLVTIAVWMGACGFIYNDLIMAHKIGKIAIMGSATQVTLALFVYRYNITSNIPTDQLVQDKICRNVYHINASYCSNLSRMADSDDYLGIKSTILTDSTTFMASSIVLITLPSVVALLFIGSWTDTYIRAKKLILIGGAVATLLEVSVLIVNDYVSALCNIIVKCTMHVDRGCISPVLIDLVLYFGHHSNQYAGHENSCRRDHYCLSIALPLGSYVGGLVLNTTPLFSTGQLHNYSAVFIIGGVAFALALIWILYMVDERRDVGEWERRFNRLSDTETDEEVAERVRQKLQKYDDNQDIHPIKLLLNLSNAREMWRTCSKRRDGWTRLQIWLLFLSMACYLMSNIGPVFFLYQFSQKVYNWDSKTYSDVTAIAHIAITLATMIFAPILLKVLKLKDTTISMVGLGSHFMQNIVRGVVLTPFGFYYSIIAGCLGGVASIGIRSHFSKIIRLDELGKVFSGLSAIEALTPLISAALFTGIFNATMDSMPGLSLIVLALILMIPFGVVLWIHLCTHLPDVDHNNDNKAISINDVDNN